jgi:membrane associated rhomboid family serine protease
MRFPSDDDEHPPGMTPAVRALLALNVAVFFLQLTLVGPADLFRWLAYSGSTVATAPWTVITYAFVHAGPWHILSNLWLLFVFGPRVEHAFGTRRFTVYYLTCALGGWLAHTMVAPRAGILLGASAAVLGVMLAYAVRWPDDEIQIFPLFITMKVKWVVACLAGINLLFGVATAGGSSGVAYVAHLGGLAAGGIFLYFAAGPGLDGVRRRVATVPDESDEPPRAIPQQPTRSRERTTAADDAVARSNATMVARSPRPSALSSRVGPRKTEELNVVLDKISRLGLESLTAEERSLLEEMSRQLRDR